jgi:hypothetical protein
MAVSADKDMSMIEGWSTRAKESKPAQCIKVDYFASHDALSGLWKGIYQGPDIGVKIVRRRDGTVALYETQDQAKLAAGDAYKWAVNNQLPPIRATKAMILPQRREFRRGV